MMAHTMPGRKRSQACSYLGPTSWRCQVIPLVRHSNKRKIVLHLARALSLSTNYCTTETVKATITIAAAADICHSGKEKDVRTCLLIALREKRERPKEREIARLIIDSCEWDRP